MERKVLEDIIASEPVGKKEFEIADDIGERNDKGRQKVGRCCKTLENKGLIYKENKQANYHITRMIYGNPELSGYLFYKAIKTILDSSMVWISTTNKFCNNELCKKIVSETSSDSDNNNTFDTNSYNDQIDLFEFGLLSLSN